MSLNRRHYGASGKYVPQLRFSYPQPMRLNHLPWPVHFKLRLAEGRASEEAVTTELIK